ncbi:MAG: c-type cytochrome [Chloroflexota bacterium]
MSGFIGVAIVGLLAILVGWLASVAWRIRNVPGKVAAGIISSLVDLLLIALTALGIAGIWRLNAPQGPPVQNVTVQATPRLVAFGAQRAHYCAGCHSPNNSEPLSGGSTNFLQGLASVYAPNLTPGGSLKTWSDGQILRALRDGVDANGHPLLIMPSDAFHHLSDHDAEALVAYLRSQPAVQHVVPQRDVNIIGLLLVGAGLFPTSAQPAVPEPQTAPAAGVTPQYGHYLVQSIGCSSCHGENLTGKKPGQGPAGPNLTYIVPQWSQSQFVSFMHTGVDPTGHKASSEMPWQDISAAFSDPELRAIYAYLHALPVTVGPNG